MDHIDRDEIASTSAVVERLVAAAVARRRPGDPLAS